MSRTESPTGRAHRYEREIERIVGEYVDSDYLPEFDAMVYELRRLAERNFDEGFAAGKLDGMRQLKDTAI